MLRRKTKFAKLIVSCLAAFGGFHVATGTFIGNRVLAQNQCNCQQWTCPICQTDCPTGTAMPNSRAYAPPSNQFAPPSYSGPNGPSNSSLPPVVSPQQNMGSSVDGSGNPLATPVPQAAPNAGSSPGLNVDQLADGMNRRSSNQEVGGLESLARSAVEFQGDFFGPLPLNSTASQVFEFQAIQSGVDSFGNPIFSLQNGLGTFTGTAPVSGSGAQTIGITDPQGTVNDNPDGFAFLNGTATNPDPLNSNSPWTLRYGFGANLRLPTSLTGRLKFAENVGLIPTDRFFFNYNYFHNVPLVANGGIGINRFTPGFEKTFLDRQASIEVRAPFATTLDSNLFATGDTNQQVEFGNLFLTAKGVLLGNDRFAATAGTSLTLPTEDDIRIFRRDGTELIRIENQSVHILPFMGFVFAPQGRFFAQTLTQIDIDTNGRPVLTQDVNGFVNSGRLRDQTLMFNSVSFGYRLFQNNNRNFSNVRSITPTFEAHWNKSLDRTSAVTNGFSTLGGSGNFETVNLVQGLTVDLFSRARFSVGYVAPVSRTDGRVFDGELRATFNQYF